MSPGKKEDVTGKRSRLYFHLEMGVSWPKKHAPPANSPHANPERSLANDQSRQLRHGTTPLNPNHITDQPNFQPSLPLSNDNKPRRPEPRHGNHAQEQWQDMRADAYGNKRTSKSSPAQKHMATDLDCGPTKGVPEVWKALPPTPAPSLLEVVGGNLSSPASQDALVFRRSHGNVPGDGIQEQEAKLGADAGLKTVNSHSTGWIKEMECLATAMMTVDNGFEDQWWNQGPRLVNVTGDLIPANANYTHHTTPAFRLMSKDLGIRTSVDEVSFQSTHCSTTGAVSPISNSSTIPPRHPPN